MKKILLALPLVILLGACSADSDVSEKAFKKVIDATYADEPVCVHVKLLLDEDVMSQQYGFGNTQIKVKYIDKNGDKVNVKAIEQLNILEKAGLYKRLADEEILLFGKVKIKNAVYKITDKGLEQFKGGNAVCLGHYQVVKLNYYTEPASLRGLKVSRVSYNVKPKLDNWAKSFLKVTDEDLEKQVLEEKEQVSNFFLTNKGWVKLK